MITHRPDLQRDYRVCEAPDRANGQDVLVAEVKRELGLTTRAAWTEDKAWARHPVHLATKT